jgi:hypothetical protein
MLLDVFVRDEKTPAPLKALAGFPFFLICNAVMQSGPFYLLSYHGLIGFAIFVPLLFCLFPLDGLVSNSLGENIKTLRKNGFSDWVTLILVFGNIVSAHVFTLLVTYYICGGRTVVEMFGNFDSYTVPVFLKLFLNIAIAEFLFYNCHALLHKYLPKIHLMHHCVIHSTFSANFIFNPIDLSIEFGGPVGSALLLHFFVWKDPFVLFLTYAFILAYYANDHNDWIKSYHYDHHGHTDSVYTAYIKYRGTPADEKVKHILQRDISSVPEKQESVKAAINATSGSSYQSI